MFRIWFCNFSIEESSIIPPAASVGPSIPSVPTETKIQSKSFWIDSMPDKKDKANSWFLPPSPLPIILTIVSPPEIMAIFWLGVDFIVFRENFIKFSASFLASSVKVNGHIIASMELKEQKIPYIIRRPIPNGGSEYWKVSDLRIID